MSDMLSRQQLYPNDGNQKIDGLIFSKFLPLSTEFLEQSKLTGSNLVEALLQAFRQLDQCSLVKNKDVVMVLGNVSSGKSTILTSLIHGPGALSTKEIKHTIKLQNGQQKIIRQKCIDMNELFLAENCFKIGHDQNEACTYMPQFQSTRLDGKEFILIDMPALSDQTQSSQFSKTFSTLLFEKILQECRSVKFIITLVADSVLSDQGRQAAKEILDCIRLCCSATQTSKDFVQPLLLFLDSLFPVVTRVSPFDDEFDIDQFRQMIKENLVAQYDSCRRRGGGAAVEGGDDFLGVGGGLPLGQGIDDFFSKFTQKIQIFDPMDREVPASEDQAIKRIILREMIGDSINNPGIPSSLIRPNQSYLSVFETLTNLLFQEQCLVSILLDKSENQKNNKDQQDTDRTVLASLTMDRDLIIKSHFKTLDFFINHNLLHRYNQVYCMQCQIVDLVESKIKGMFGLERGSSFKPGSLMNTFKKVFNPVKQKQYLQDLVKKYQLEKIAQIEQKLDTSTKDLHLQEVPSVQDQIAQLKQEYNNLLYQKDLELAVMKQEKDSWRSKYEQAVQDLRDVNLFHQTHRAIFKQKENYFMDKSKIQQQTILELEGERSDLDQQTKKQARRVSIFKTTMVSNDMSKIERMMEMKIYNSIMQNKIKKYENEMKSRISMIEGKKEKQFDQFHMYAEMQLGSSQVVHERLNSENQHVSPLDNRFSLKNRQNTVIFDDEVLNKDVVINMKSNLSSLVKCLEKAFSDIKLEKYTNKNLVIAIGNTGCGKSTMLSSLLFGSGSLMTKKIKKEITLATGKRKNTIQHVICKKEESTDFEIGHSCSKSMTFLPQFHKNKQTNTWFVDVAGLQDTDGIQVDLINCFINKKLISKAGTVRFIFPITQSQIFEMRGHAVRQQVKVLRNICSNNLLGCVDCIQPIITKIKQRNHLNNDLEIMRSNVHQQLQNELNDIQNVFSESLHSSSVVSSYVGASSTQFGSSQLGSSIIGSSQIENGASFYESVVQEVAQDEQITAETTEFYRKLASKFEIFDPLDRPITIDDDSDSEGGDYDNRDQDADANDTNQAIKQKELLMKIETMPRINVYETDLRVPLTNSQYDYLNQKFDDLTELCHQKGQEYIKQVENDNHIKVDNFEMDPTILDIVKIFKFFYDHQLIEDAKQKYTSLIQFIKTTNQMIQSIESQMKLVLKLEQQQREQATKLFIISIQEMFIQRADKENYHQLVPRICRIIEDIEKYKNNQYQLIEQEDHRMQIDYLLQNAQTAIQLTVQEICNFSNLENFYTFIFELRKFDVSNNFTVKLLQDVIKSEVLMKIITSNQWNVYFNKMEVNQNAIHAQIVNGSGQSLCYSSDLLKTHIGIQQISDFDAQLEKENSSSTKKRNLTFFRFLITPDGFKILDGFDRYLVAQGKKKQHCVEVKQPLNIGFVLPHESLVEPRNMLWFLVSADPVGSTPGPAPASPKTSSTSKTDQSIELKKVKSTESGSHATQAFTFQLNYGEIKPRLLKITKKLSKKAVKVSVDAQDGYHDVKKNQWSINIIL